MIRLLVEVCLWAASGVVVMGVLFAVLSQAITTVAFSPWYALLYAALIWALLKAIGRLTR